MTGTSNYRVDLVYPVYRSLALYNKNRVVARFSDPDTVLEIGTKMAELSVKMRKNIEQKGDNNANLFSIQAR